MSQKGNQNSLEDSDKKIPINGDSTNEIIVDLEEKETKPEEKQESSPVMKKRPSKRTSGNKISEENDSKSNKKEQIVEQTNKDEKADESAEIKPLEEAEREVLNGSSDTPVDLEKPSDNSHDSEENEKTEDIFENKDKEKNSKEEFISESDIMEPLVIQPDEPCPELQFDESDDQESLKHSPVLSPQIKRCMTRRSQNRNIPTPNTPKTIYEPESEKDGGSDTGSGTPLPGPECPLKAFNLNETTTSSANVSMTVQVGGNETRTEDFSDGESELLKSLRSKGSSSSSQFLTSRRSLRSLRKDERSKNLRDSLQRSKMHMFSPFGRDLMERAPSVKRKERSETPEERKRIKTDSANGGFMSILSSPLTSLKNKFSSTPTDTSTPKLTSYKDEKNHIDGEFVNQVEMPQEKQNNWCEIM